MIQHFIVTNTFTHQIDCFCPDEEHVDLVTLKDGDVIEVTDERKFTYNNGWYFLIFINFKKHFYISLDDLDLYYSIGSILSPLDVDLKTNYMQFQINHALDTKNELLFLNYTTELNAIKSLKEKYDTLLNREISTFSL